MKLPERTFKAGDRVFSLSDGFQTVEACHLTDLTIVIKRTPYAHNGRRYPRDAHRSLFTPEEAKELFGVEEEKPKVKRWLYWYMSKKYKRPQSDYN